MGEAPEQELTPVVTSVAAGVELKVVSVEPMEAKMKEQKEQKEQKEETEQKEQTEEQDVHRDEGQLLGGVVKRYSSKHGYGFIAVDDKGADCFVHQSEICAEGFRCLQEGIKVVFTHVTRGGKPTATQVKPAPGTDFKLYRSRAEVLQKNSPAANSVSIGQSFGSVKWFNSKKGFGFIVLEGGNGEVPLGVDVFVHIKEVSGQVPLHQGQCVNFETNRDQAGKLRARKVSRRGAMGHPGNMMGPMGPVAYPMSRMGPYDGNRLGQIKFYKADKGYGFIHPFDGSREMYFGKTALVNEEQEAVLREGEVVSYQLRGNNTNKTWAANVMVLPPEQAPRMVTMEDMGMAPRYAPNHARPGIVMGQPMPAYYAAY